MTQLLVAPMRVWTVARGRSVSCAAGILVFSGQLAEQRLGVFEVGGVEALGEPVVDFGEHRVRLVATIAVAQQPGEAD